MHIVVWIPIYLIMVEAKQIVEINIESYSDGEIEVKRLHVSKKFLFIQLPLHVSAFNGCGIFLLLLDTKPTV